MTPLTRRQQRIAHAYAGEIVCLICRCSPDAINHMKQSMRGGTALHIGDTVCSYQTTKKGIEIRDTYAGEALDTLTWGALSRHVSALPDSLRDYPEHRDVHRPPGFDEPFHVQINNMHPPTEANTLALLLWHDHSRAHRRRVLDAAFPLALIEQAEPANLFEMAGIA